MTTVIALAEPRGVWMAADTLTNIYERPVRGWARKILRLPVGELGGEVLLGISGNAGMVSKARAVWADGFPDPPDDPDAAQEWADAIASALTTPMVEAGMVSEGRLDGHFLLGYPGGLWTLQHHLAILCPDGRGAVGSGEGPAMGALDAFCQSDVPPYRAVSLAATIAVSRDRWSGLPLQLEHIELSDPAPPAEHQH